jgi:ribonuclease HI
MTTFWAYADGACSNNGKPNAKAGAAAILIAKDDTGRIVKERPITGGVPGEQTNNRAELQAVILALESLQTKGVEIKIVTDSQYVHNTIVLGWQRRTNHDLWQRLDELIAQHHVMFEKCEGHSTDVYNNRADKLARKEAGSNIYWWGK